MTDVSTRRQFLHRAGRVSLGTAGLALFGGCAVGPGQGRGGAPTARVATIGYLPASADEGDAGDAALLEVFREGLRDLGWVEGENLRLETRLLQSDRTAQDDVVEQLVRLPVDVLVAVGTPSIRPALVATSTLPVVMMQGPPDAVERGWAASIQRPGGNVTGLLQPPHEIFGKRLELLREAVPHLSRAAYIATQSLAVVGGMHETGQSMGVQMDIIRAESERELELALAAIDRDGAEAMLVWPAGVTITYRARIIDFAAQRRLPAMFHSRAWAVAGGLMSYGDVRPAYHRRAAVYVDRILRGTKPGDLPIEFPTQYELVINLKTAATLGLTIPDSLLAQASEVIR